MGHDSTATKMVQWCYYICIKEHIEKSALACLQITKVAKMQVGSKESMKGCEATHLFISTGPYSNLAGDFSK